eukprot:753418-Hanusia_phi.AAC.1
MRGGAGAGAGSVGWGGVLISLSVVNVNGSRWGVGVEGTDAVVGVCIPGVGGSILSPPGSVVKAGYVIRAWTPPHRHPSADG